MHRVPLQCNGGIGAGGTKCPRNRCGLVHCLNKRVWFQWWWWREASVSTGSINHNCFVHVRHRLFGQQTCALSTCCTGFWANDPRALHLSNWEFRVFFAIFYFDREKLHCPTHINLQYYCTYRKDVHSPKTFAIFFDTILPLIGFPFDMLKYVDDHIMDKYEPQMVELCTYSTAWHWCFYVKLNIPVLHLTFLRRKKLFPIWFGAFLSLLPTRNV